jgi:GAF domain-containing protein
LDSAAAFAGADMGFVSLVDADGEDLVARVTFGVAAGTSGKLTTKVGEGIIGRAFAGTYIAVSEDLTLDSRFVCPYLKSLDVKSLISLPLIGSKQPLGMLTLCTFTPHHFTEEEKDSLCVAADRIAAAVENMRLETELSRDRGQIELMEAVTKDASAQEGMSGVYKTFINHATKIIDFDRAALTIWHSESQELEILAVDTKAPKTWLGSGLKLPKDATPVAKVVETSRPLLRDEIAGDEYPADKLLIEEGIHSEVFIPLMSKGEVLGIVNLGSFKPHAFAREDLELLEPVARQLGLVLDNARLLEETKRLSLVDSLTGLYNHRYFYEAVAREVTRSARHGRPVSVMMIGIDRFKDFNNNYGHLEGDWGLMEIGKTLRRVVW